MIWNSGTQEGREPGSRDGTFGKRELIHRKGTQRTRKKEESLGRCSTNGGIACKSLSDLPVEKLPSLPDFLSSKWRFLSIVTGERMCRFLLTPFTH